MTFEEYFTSYTASSTVTNIASISHAGRQIIGMRRIGDGHFNVFFKSGKPVQIEASALLKIVFE
jgi:hypothetical protein